MDIGSFVIGIIVTGLLVGATVIFWHDVVEPNRQWRKDIRRDVDVAYDKARDNELQINRADTVLKMFEISRQTHNERLDRHHSRLDALEEYVYGGNVDVKSEEESE